MAVSRYRNLNVISGSYYETFDLSSKDLSKIPSFNIRTSSEDRLDTLAHKYLGNGEYWWIIALMNDIDWVFNFVPGEILKIPVDINDVLRLV